MPMRHTRAAAADSLDAAPSLASYVPVRGRVSCLGLAEAISNERLTVARDRTMFGIVE